LDEEEIRMNFGYPLKGILALTGWRAIEMKDENNYTLECPSCFRKAHNTIFVNEYLITQDLDNQNTAKV
jgi:hypothetical protein